MTFLPVSQVVRRILGGGRMFLAEEEREGETPHVAEYGQTREISISVVRPSVPSLGLLRQSSSLPYANMSCSNLNRKKLPAFKSRDRISKRHMMLIPTGWIVAKHWMDGR